MVVRVIVLALAVLSVAANAAVKTDLPRTSVPITDTFRISYTVDGQAPRPDFSPLQQDFEVLGTSQSTSKSVNRVNGQTQQSTKWIIDLMARREGELTIPPIDFGAGRSEPLTVTITAADSGAATADEDIFLEVEADPVAPYVQAQVRFSLRIFRAVRTANATLTEPEIVTGDGLIERIGDDHVYQSSRGGARYSVVERRYAIFPQSSGPLVIGPMTFGAVLGGGQRSVFDPRPRGRRVHVRSEAMELDVQPIPESFTGRSWLPAERVELTEDWPGEAGAQWRVGEPLTRTVTLRARGLTASQLADIGAGVPEGLKQYSDQPEVDEGAVDGSLAAVRRETVALIPSQAGRFELPEIAVPWWNTVEDRLEYARVPARAVTVLPAAGAPAQAAPGGPVTAPEGQSSGSDAASVDVASSQSNAWAWLSALLALGWLTTLALWVWSRRRAPGGSSSQKTQQPPRPKAVIGELERACAANEKDAASQALLLWGATRWPGNPVRSLGELAARLDGELQGEVHGLSRARYAPAAETWNGDALWKAFEANRSTRSKKRRTESPQLEPLYR